MKERTRATWMCVGRGCARRDVLVVDLTPAAARARDGGRPLRCGTCGGLMRFKWYGDGIEDDVVAERREAEA